MENFSSFLAALHSRAGSGTELLLHGNRRADDRHEEHEDDGVARDEDSHTDLIADLRDGVLETVPARVGLARHEAVKATVLSAGMELVVDIAREDFLLILALDCDVNRDTILDALDGAVENLSKVPVIDGKGRVAKSRGRLDARADAEAKDAGKGIVQAMARDHFEERDAELDEAPALRVVLLEVAEAHDGSDSKDDPEPPEGLHGLTDEQDDLRGKWQVDAGVDLPLATQVILLIGQSMQAFWWLWIVLAVAAVMGFRYFKENYPERWCLIQLRIPFFKVITRHRLHYTFARIFGLCISSGIQPTTALSYTALAVDNWYLRKVLDRAVKSIKDGVPIDVAIEREDKKKVLSRDIYNKLHAGAQNGGLDRLMTSQANTSRNRLEYAVSKIGDKISMTVLIPSYAVVLVLLMSIIGPTIAMQQKLGAGAGAGM